MRDGRVVAVSLSPVHGFSKTPVECIQIVAGWGVEGDAHAGATTQHLYRKRKTPHAPNLTQVHLLQDELFAEVAQAGFALAPGLLGENVLVHGVELLGLPVGARLRLGDEAVVEITGLRDPCKQINGVQAGLMKACLGQNPDGSVQRKAGVMGRAVASGTVRAGDAVEVELPPQPWGTMRPV